MLLNWFYSLCGVALCESSCENDWERRKINRAKIIFSLFIFIFGLAQTHGTQWFTVRSAMCTPKSTSHSLLFPYSSVSIEKRPKFQWYLRWLPRNKMWMIERWIAASASETAKTIENKEKTSVLIQIKTLSVKHIHQKYCLAGARECGTRVRAADISSYTPATVCPKQMNREAAKKNRNNKRIQW